MLSFYVKFVQTDRWRDTDGRRDRQTTVKQYDPNLSIRGHNNCVKTILRITWNPPLEFNNQPYF